MQEHVAQCGLGCAGAAYGSSTAVHVRRLWASPLSSVLRLRSAGRTLSDGGPFSAEHQRQGVNIIANGLLSDGIFLLTGSFSETYMSSLSSAGAYVVQIALYWLPSG